MQHSKTDESSSPDGRNLFPSGTVTYLLTDIEGSTRRWEASPTQMRAALERHDTLLGRLIKEHLGRVLTERGEGDSFFAVFDQAGDAVAAAAGIQLAIQREAWPEGMPIKVRMAIHTGESGAGHQGPDYRGPDVNRCARIRAMAHGEQVLLSAPTATLVRAALPDGARLEDLGLHRLRDLGLPERVYQLLHPQLRQDFPPIRSLDTFKHNLPVQLTSFVGRERDLQHVKDLLARSRLVTLTGPGGSGKTRLALQAAGDLVEDFDDGVWFVDLAPVSDPQTVPRAVAAVVGGMEIQGQSLSDTVVEHLHGKSMLVLLDNCEHLIDASASLAESLLRSLPDLRLLVTSQETLNVPGETLWPVPTLSLPDPKRDVSADALQGFESVRLFLDRARAARVGFSLTENDAGSVAEICRRLDGVPLAIELAAARVKLLSPQDILTRLQDRFRLLSVGARTAMPRHQTLRATVEWSHDLLSEPERVLFRRLSILAASFDLEAAEHVCRGEDLAGEDILDLLGRLVDRSLVVTDPEEGGSVRYRLLETLRQYGRERLAEAGESEDAAAALFAYFSDFAERAYAARFKESLAWLPRLERTHDDLRAALDWSLERDPTGHLRLAGALAWFWHLHSEHLVEGAERLETALALHPGGDAIRGRALTGYSMVLTWLGSVERARQTAAEAMEIWRSLGDPLEVGLAQEAQGWSYCLGGENERALDLTLEALATFRRHGDEWLAIRGLVSVGQVLVALQRVDQAVPVAEELLEASARLGDLRGRHYALHYLGDCSLALGHVEEAEERYRLSLQAALAYGNIAEAGVEMQGVAMSAAGRGDLARGLELSGAAEAKMREVGMDISGFEFWVEYLRRYLEPAREALGPEAAAHAQARGAAMAFDDAVELALGTSAAPTTNEPSPKISRISWGAMDVEGLGTGTDFKVWPGGGRPWDWNETGTNHDPGIQPADVQELLDHGSGVVVLSRGQELRLHTSPETLDLLRERGITVHVEETKAAVKLYNELAEEGAQVGGLFHSTC